MIVMAKVRQATCDVGLDVGLDLSISYEGVKLDYHDASDRVAFHVPQIIHRLHTVMLLEFLGLISSLS